MTQDDLMIAARALGFLQNPPTGQVRVGVVYAPNVPRSVDEADNLDRMLGSGLKVGTLVLLPAKVKIDDVASASVGLFLLADYVGSDGSRLASAAKAKRIPCVTADIAAVESGYCAMGVRSQPRIEIVVNRAAAESFATVFRMLITEI
jgi:ABC-type uncharacterized transport system substrate-binding protein